MPHNEATPVYLTERDNSHLRTNGTKYRDREIPYSLFSSLSPLNICQGRIIPSNYTDSFHCVPTTQQWGFVSRSTSGSSRTQTGAHSEDWIDPLSTELRSSTTEMNFVFLSKFTHCQTPAVTQEPTRSQFRFCSFYFTGGVSKDRASAVPDQLLLYVQMNACDVLEPVLAQTPHSKGL